MAATVTNTLKHGESLYNLDGRIGGDTMLSPRGELYAKKLPELVRESVGVSGPKAHTNSVTSPVNHD